MKKKKLTIVTLKGRLTVDTDDLESALLAFRQQYDADPERYEEDVQALLLTMQGVKPSKIRSHPDVEHKLKNTKQFRKFVSRLKAQSQKPFRQSTLPQFVRENWSRPATSPAHIPSKGLRSLAPQVALNLLRSEGFAIPDSWYRDSCDTYRKMLRRLNLKRQHK